MPDSYSRYDIETMGVLPLGSTLASSVRALSKVPDPAVERRTRFESAAWADSRLVS